MAYPGLSPMLVSIAFPFFLPYLGVFHFFIHSSSTIGFHQCFCFYDRRICTHSVDPSLIHFLCESLGFPVSTGIFPHSLPEWAFRTRPGLRRICLCPKVARIVEHKFANR